MATIKPIEGKSVHQIQSGQVIVDLCSVVKELVENALDASATSIDVRFKNNGLDSIEVQDNGSGIAQEDYETIALKHYTSKLSSYDDLTSLTTFGFRGEALSSLCALSKFHVVTARASDGPKGTKLDFETSGRLRAKSVVASQKGTTVTVEDIFLSLPVRRRELEKNIKREYGKVLGLLHAYACISTGVKFSVSNVPSKGKKMVVFSTKANPTTRENISNVYGAKTLSAIIPLDLTFEMHSTIATTQSAKTWGTQGDMETKPVQLAGHISRPVPGEGRQTPDRQMFFVNSRPCALPQVAKAINEVYRSYNITQSPFIFANLELDTNAYDVNVSPDKRTILLHDQTALLEALKESLIDLFESHDQSVPSAATPSLRKLPHFRHPVMTKSPSIAKDDKTLTLSSENEDEHFPGESLVRKHAEGKVESRDSATKAAHAIEATRKRRDDRHRETLSMRLNDGAQHELSDRDDNLFVDKVSSTHSDLPRAVQDFNTKMGIDVPGPDSIGEAPGIHSTETNSESQPQIPSGPTATPGDEIPSVSNTPQKGTPGVLPSAFDRMRPKRAPLETAIVTIGNETTIRTLGSSGAKKRRIHTPKFNADGARAGPSTPSFVSGLSMYVARGERTQEHVETESDESDAADTVIPVGMSLGKPLACALSTPVTTTTTNLDSDTDEVSVADDEDINPAEMATSGTVSDDEYVDDDEKKAREEDRINKMIQAVEERAARPTSDNVRRAVNALKTRVRKDTTRQLAQCVETSTARIEREVKYLAQAMQDVSADRKASNTMADNSTASAEERLSLTVSKSDFARMRIVGQFNLGFILATRSASNIPSETSTHARRSDHDELFIIDQHASDEKYNFERLQSQTIVQNQRLVHPKQLDLTAIEEEIILNHPDALAKNGFEISIDTSGDLPVGQRCKLTSLPMSREVTFALSDLEELLAMLSEYTSGVNDVPRPSKVRRMFAMRACRSSIMVGKTLTQQQMGKVVTHMGELDKPWNCPHGRPTMRHLFSMDGFEEWSEDHRTAGFDDHLAEGGTDWETFVKQSQEEELSNTATNENDQDDEEESDAEDDQEDDEPDARLRADPRKWLFTQPSQDTG